MATVPKSKVDVCPQRVKAAFHCSHCYAQGHRSNICPLRSLPRAEAMERTEEGRKMLATWRDWFPREVSNALQRFPRADWPAMVASALRDAEKKQPAPSFECAVLH